MEQKSVRQVAAYYREIPGMLRILRSERADLEHEYSSLHGVASDGMPHGSEPGRGAEALGIRAAQKDLAGQTARIDAKLRELERDQAAIRGCLDGLNGRYKRILVMRFVHGYSWAKISVKLSVPDSTVRNWCGRALDRLGEALDALPDRDGLLERASCART